MSPCPIAFAQTEIAGLWGTEQVFGPLVRGVLTIDGRAKPWRAAIAGFDVPVDVANGRASFALPGDAGAFRGRMNPTSNTIDGEWIQPPGVMLNNRYATPLRLAPAGRALWRGSVTPLDDHISLYLSIAKNPDGSMTATIANPEENLFRRKTYTVTVEGENVTFANPKRSVDIVHGTIDRSTGQLWLAVLESRPPLAFSRRSAGDAVGFYPRTPQREVAYRKPVALHDGWETASLADVGMDEKPILDLVRRIVSSEDLGRIQSLLIARRGKLVFEEYFYGFDAERPHDMRSASKTFAPLLAGIARDHGAAIAPASTLSALFSGEQPFAHRDPRKDRITLKTLMTMTSGMACDDNDDASPGNEDVMQNQTAQPDWTRYTLDLPMAGEPGGKHAVYCSATVNLVGAAVSRATKTPLPELFDAFVARPLGFGTYHMNLTPTGDGYMGGGLYLRPRDELKLGQLVLSGGVWRGRRVVSASWMRESTAAHSLFDPQTDYDAPHEYGYGWHINRLTAMGRSYRAISAGGNGGQIVMAIPDLDLVIAFNGGSYGEFPKWYRWGLQLVPQYVIPAVQPSR